MGVQIQDDFVFNTKCKTYSWTNIVASLSAIEAIYTQRRQQVVQVVKSKTVRVFDDYRAKLLSTWQRDNPGKTPESEGLVVEQADHPKLGKVMVVLKKKLAEDEFDVQLEGATSAQLLEVVDDGKGSVRANQTELKYANAQKLIAGVVNAENKATSSKEVTSFLDVAPAPQGSGVTTLQQSIIYSFVFWQIAILFGFVDI